MTAHRGCGACNLCCKLLHVPDIGKPAQMTCWWTTIHGGCLRHAEKPNPREVDHDPDAGTFTLKPSQEGKDINLLACATFKCFWLESQEFDESPLPRNLRPDLTHVVVGPQDPNDDKLVYIQVDPERPGAWQKPDVVALLNYRFLSRGARLEVICGDARFEISEPI